MIKIPVSGNKKWLNNFFAAPRFLKKHTVRCEKSRKMIGVTLRYTWITGAMILGPWSGARPPIGEAVTKNVYISPGSGSLVAGKNTQSVVHY